MEMDRLVTTLVGSGVSSLMGVRPSVATPVVLDLGQVMDRVPVVVSGKV